MGNFDEDFGQYIPFDLFGSGSRIAARKQDERDQQNRWSIGKLLNEAPSADDLSVDYDRLGTTDEYGNLMGDPSAITRTGRADLRQSQLMNSLDALVRGGGYTAADRNQQQAMAAANAQQVGAMNQAALRGMEARGMGGGGASLAAQLAGSQGLASANAQNQAAIQQAAMNRLMQGYGMQGQLAGQMNSQELARQQAINDYNQRQLDWRRGRAATNTALGNQSKESRAAANQTAYGNKERGTAMLTGQYQNESQNAQQQMQNRNQSSAALGNLVSGILGGVGQIANAARRRPSDGDG